MPVVYGKRNSLAIVEGAKNEVQFYEMILYNLLSYVSTNCAVNNFLWIRMAYENKLPDNENRKTWFS